MDVTEGDDWGLGHCHIYLGVIAESEHAVRTATAHFREAANRPEFSADSTAVSMTTLITVAAAGIFSTSMTLTYGRAMRVGSFQGTIATTRKIEPI